MHIEKFPENVTNSTGGIFEGQNDSLFLRVVFDHLHEIMGDSFKDFTFVIHRRMFGEFAGSKINLDPGGDKRILIVIADEKEVFPVEEYLSYRAVFRAYGCPEFLAPNIHSFPVGYFNAAGSVESIPFDDRSTSVFFSGCLNSNRIELYRQFRPVRWLPGRIPKHRKLKELLRRAVSKTCDERNFDASIPGGRISFTEWFGKGLPPEEYAAVLRDTKIALCPPGFHSHETIRHWEAMRLGCVIISDVLPPSRFYRGSPIIQLGDWDLLLPLLKELLADNESLLQLHRSTTDWWKSACSERSVARYMADVLAG